MICILVYKCRERRYIHYVSLNGTEVKTIFSDNHCYLLNDQITTTTNNNNVLLLMSLISLVLFYFCSQSLFKRVQAYTRSFRVLWISTVRGFV